MMPPLGAGDSGSEVFAKSTGAASNPPEHSTDLHAIFDIVELPMVIASVECKVAGFNRAAAGLLHLTTADIGQSLRHIQLLTDRPTILERCAQVIADGIPCRCEIKDDEKHFILRIAVYPGGTQPTKGAVLTFTNNTAQRSSIEQAIYEREFTKTILNTVQEPIAILSAALRVQSANRAFFTMFNVSRDEANDCLLTELKHHTWDVPGLSKYLKDALSDPNQVPLEFDHDFPRVGHRTVLVSARPLLVKGRAEPLILLMLSDITDRKQAHEALRVSETRFRTLFESMDEGYCVIDMIFDDQHRPIDYRFVEVNPAFERQTGLVSANGRSMREIAPTHEEHWFDIYGRVALTGEPTRFENRAAALQRWYEVCAFRVGPAEQRRVGIVFNDISARKQSEDALHRLNTELEDRVQARTEELTNWQARLRALAADLNLAEQRERQRLASDLHDYLGQLLALSLMKLSQARQKPMEAALGKIFGEVVGVTEQALDYTRTLVSQLCPPVLHEFGLSAALQWLAEQMHQRNLGIAVEFKSEIPPLPEEQALLLFQSVRELLINCVKHARVHEATIAVERHEGSLRITVSDHGCGFDASPGAITTKFKVASAGFGLFSIRERMLSLGGGLDLESVPGKGTVATLIVPLTSANGEPSWVDDQSAHVNGTGESSRIGGPLAKTTDKTSNGDPSHRRALSPNGSKIRVLIADDHAMIRQGLCSVLDHYGEIQVVGEAANGEEAVALANQLHPDVVLMDVTMPKMDGIEATKLIKRTQPDVVVIGLSVHTAGQVGTAMKDAGAAAFINKEAAVDELYQTIQTARRPPSSQLIQ